MRISQWPMSARAIMHVVRTGIQKRGFAHWVGEILLTRNVASTQRGNQSETFLKFQGWSTIPIDPLFSQAQLINTAC